MPSSMIIRTGIFLLSLLVVLSACKHDPTLLGEDDDPVVPIDTIDNPIDTTMVGEPCDPELIYFEQDILPVLLSNCAFSGCHDAASAQDGVVLISYETVIQTADVEAFDLEHSEIYEVLVEDDEDKRMPPPPNARLSNAQINRIAKWILQGAENLQCDPNSEGCNTTDVTYSQTVRPVIQNFCQGCHSGATPAAGIDMSTHGGVQTVAQNGRLYGAISWQPGFVRMPKGGNQLPACTIDQIKAWIDAGAPNN